MTAKEKDEQRTETETLKKAIDEVEFRSEYETKSNAETVRDLRRGEKGKNVWGEIDARGVERGKRAVGGYAARSSGFWVGISPSSENSLGRGLY